MPAAARQHLHRVEHAAIRRQLQAHRQLQRLAAQPRLHFGVAGVGEGDGTQGAVKSMGFDIQRIQRGDVIVHQLRLDHPGAVHFHGRSVVAALLQRGGDIAVQLVEVGMDIGVLDHPVAQRALGRHIAGLRHLKRLLLGVAEVPRLAKSAGNLRAEHEQHRRRNGDQHLYVESLLVVGARVVHPRQRHCNGQVGQHHADRRAAPAVAQGEPSARHQQHQQNELVHQTRRLHGQHEDARHRQDRDRGVA